MKDEYKNPPAIMQLIISLLALALSGWFVKLMWGWFIVPLGVMPISLWHGLGIGLFISYFRLRPPQNNDSYSFYEKFFTSFGIDVLILFLAFFTSLFMRMGGG